MVLSCGPGGNSNPARYGTVRVFVEFEPANDHASIDDTLAAMSALGPSFIRAASRSEADVSFVRATETTGVTVPCMTGDTTARIVAVRVSDLCQCDGGACVPGSESQRVQFIVAHALGHWTGMDDVGQASGVLGRGNVMDARGAATRTAAGFVEEWLGNTVFHPTDADIAEFRRVHP